MKKIVCVGELLIDMLPSESNTKLEHVTSFIKKPGGAPANVAVAIKRLGGHSQVVSQVGDDAFGHFLIDTIKNEGIDTSTIYKTKDHFTSLAFVSIDENGERDFVFYRDPAADQMLNLSREVIETIDYDVLHFGSVGLADYPMKQTTDRWIEHAKEHHKTISFDVNLRLSLFKDINHYFETVKAYIKHANILKFSKEELQLLYGNQEVETIIKLIQLKHHHVILVSDGANGVSAYTQQHLFFQDAFKVKAVDTTGAGDALMGAFLNEYAKQEDNASDPSWIKEALLVASRVASLTVQKKGAMEALPYLENLIKN